MKLAEALNLRADLQKRTEQLRQRLIVNSKVQEGDLPSENPEDLLKELDSNIDKLESLITRINITNCQTKDKKSDNSITELIAKRDTLSLKISILRSFVMEASARVNRYSKDEIRIISTINVQKLQKKVDKQSKILRELDMQIQELNWATELL